MVKLTFLCGSLEFGRDGVGDYTRLLASELLRQGHQSCIVALNDRHIKEEYMGVQEVDGVSINVLRIPSSWPAKDRFERCRKFIDSFKPEWLSLQFVPYSFNDKGIPLGLHKYFLDFGTKYQWHVMFHELWLDKPERLSQQLIMLLQKFIISRFIKNVKPSIVNVSIGFNKNRLKQIGCSSEVLGLFGNIIKQSSYTRTPDKFQTKASIRILYFGGSPRGEYLEQVIAGLKRLCIKENGRVAVLLVTPASANKNQFIEKLDTELSIYEVEVVDCGFVESYDLSVLLSSCTVGIARSEPYLIGKSGSAIAMLEHGLPVWMPKWQTNEAVDIDFRGNLLFSDLYEAVHCKSHPDYLSRLPSIAQEFVSALTH